MRPVLSHPRAFGPKRPNKALQLHLAALVVSSRAARICIQLVSGFSSSASSCGKVLRVQRAQLFRYQGSCVLEGKLESNVVR